MFIDLKATTSALCIKNLLTSLNSLKFYVKYKSTIAICVCNFCKIKTFYMGFVILFNVGIVCNRY